MKRFQKVCSLVFVLALIFSFAGQCLAANNAGLDNFYKKQSLSAGKFRDIQWNAEWFFENVKTVYEYDLMTGTSGTTFSPTATLTLAESVTLAARINHIYRYGTALDPNDYGGNSWYDPYVSYARSNGIIGSYSNYTAAASRAEFSKILAASISSSDLSGINSIARGAIPDVDTSKSYADAVYSLYRAGVLTGSDEYGTFNPDSTISRAEAAAIITRIVDPSLRKSFVLKEKVSSSQENSIPAVLVERSSNWPSEYSPTVTFHEDMTCDVLFNMASFMGPHSGTYELLVSENGKRVIKVDLHTFEFYDGIEHAFSYFYLVETDGSGWTFYGENVGLTCAGTTFEPADSTKVVASKATKLPGGSITEGDYFEGYSQMEVKNVRADDFLTLDVEWYRRGDIRNVKARLYGNLAFFYSDADAYSTTCGMVEFSGSKALLSVFETAFYSVEPGPLAFEYASEEQQSLATDKQYLNYLLWNDDEQGWIREDNDFLGGVYNGVYMRFFPNGSMWYFYGEDHAGSVDYQEYNCNYRLEKQVLYLGDAAYDIDMYSTGVTSMTLKARGAYSVDLSGYYWLNESENYQWINEYA